MTRLSIAKACPLALAAAVSCLALACSVFEPAGDGGWSQDRRRQELVRASAMTAGVARSSEATDPGGDAALRRLDLATALRLAARHNRTIAAASAGVDAAAADVSIARSALLPSAGARAAWQWYSDEQTSAVNVVLPDGTTPVVAVREQDFGTMSTAVRLALDLSGELRHGLGAAQASYRAEAARAWGVQLEEERAVTAAYYGLLEARQLRDVASRTVALHERQLADATTRFDQGRLTRNEVLVVEVALVTSRQSLLILDNSIATARRTLNRLTGLPIEAQTEVLDVAGRPDLPALDATLAAARANNPLIATMLEETQAADERLTSAKRARLPRFGAAAGYDATTARTLEPNDYASAGVVVEFEPFYSFRREGEIARLDAGSRRSRLLLDRSVREIEALVRDSHDRVRERLAAIDAAGVGVVQAEENLRIRQVQFNEGRATSEDLLDAAEIATRQRAFLASATYQAHARRAELQQLMGQPLSGLEEVRASTANPEQRDTMPPAPGQAAAQEPVASPAPDPDTGEAQP